MTTVPANLAGLEQAAARAQAATAPLAATLERAQRALAPFAAACQQAQRMVAQLEQRRAPGERARRAHAARVTVSNAAQAAERRRVLTLAPVAAEHWHQWPQVSDLRAARRALVGELHQGCAPNYRQQATQQRGLALTE